MVKNYIPSAYFDEWYLLYLSHTRTMYLYAYILDIELIEMLRHICYQEGVMLTKFDKRKSVCVNR